MRCTRTGHYSFLEPWCGEGDVAPTQEAIEASTRKDSENIRKSIRGQDEDGALNKESVKKGETQHFIFGMACARTE
jgi:hypothetical protein